MKYHVKWVIDQTCQHSPMHDSLFVRKGVDGEHQRYTDGLALAFSGCRKAIKQEGLMVFTFHHSNRKAWESLVLVLRHGDFRVTNCFPVLAEGKSGFHSDQGNLKWDIVFVCRPGMKIKAQNFRPGYSERWIETRFKKWEIEVQKSGLNFGM